MQFIRIRRYKCKAQGAREKGYLPIPQQQLLINVLQQTPVGRNYQNYKLIRKIKNIQRIIGMDYKTKLRTQSRCATGARTNRGRYKYYILGPNTTLLECVQNMGIILIFIQTKRRSKEISLKIFLEYLQGNTANPNSSILMRFGEYIE